MSTDLETAKAGQEDSSPDKIALAKEEIIKCAQELAHPKNLGQREYIEWEATVQDKLRNAVFNLEKLSKEGKA